MAKGICSCSAGHLEPHQQVFCVVIPWTGPQDTLTATLAHGRWGTQLPPIKWGSDGEGGRLKWYRKPAALYSPSDFGVHSLGVWRIRDRLPSDGLLVVPEAPVTVMQVTLFSFPWGKCVLGSFQMRGRGRLCLHLDSVSLCICHGDCAMKGWL